MICPDCTTEYPRLLEQDSGAVCGECEKFLEALEVTGQATREALQLSQQGEHNVAIAKLEEIVSKHSHRCNASWFRSELLGYMAIVRENAGDFREAVNLYRARQRTGFRTLDSYLANQSALADGLYALGDHEMALHETTVALGAIQEETMSWALSHLAFYARIAKETGRELPATLSPLIRRLAQVMGQDISDESLDRHEGRAAAILDLQKLKQAQPTSQSRVEIEPTDG